MLTLSRLLLITLLCLVLTQSFAIRKKYSEKELEEIEDQWFEDEDVSEQDLDHWKKGPDGYRKPPTPQYKTEMVFVGLKGSRNDDETSDWAGRQSDILNSGGVPIKAYPVEPGRALFVIERGQKDLQQVKSFMLDNPDVADFEFNQKKYYPAGSKSKSSKSKSKNPVKPVAQPIDDEEFDEAHIEAVRQALEKGESFESIKKLNEKKAKLADSNLGGAGGPIPAEMPDEL